MGAAKTYNITIKNLTTDESVDLYGSKRKDQFGIAPPLKGFGDPDIRTSQYLFSGWDGGNITEQFYGMRQIPLNIFFHSESFETFAEMTAKIARVVKIRDPLQVQLFTPSGNIYQLIAKLTQPLDPQVEYPLLADYNIELVAGDPTIYDFTDGAALKVTLARETMGGLEWVDDGLDWEDADDMLGWAASGGGVVVDNTGNADVWPTIEISGVCHNPSIKNQQTGQTVALDLTMAADDILKIDMRNKEVTLNGVNIFNNLEQAEFWRLVPSTNEVVFDSLSDTDTATAVLMWYNGYTGVL